MKKEKKQLSVKVAKTVPSDEVPTSPMMVSSMPTFGEMMLLVVHATVMVLHLVTVMFVLVTVMMMELLNVGDATCFYSACHLLQFIV